MRNCFVVVLMLFAALANAQDAAEVKIKVTPLRGGLSMLVGQGGNILASVGADGAYIIDDQFAPLNEKIRAALKTLGAPTVKFVINTHWHGDHTGGNESFGSSGALIVAQDNVRKRMSVDQFMGAVQRKVPAAAAAALPVITFSEEVSLHFNGESARVVHLPNAHTDGDALVFFPKANVLHMGDVFFNGLYPFIDVDSGGSIDGYLAGIDKGLALADAETQIVPGHGPLSGRAGLLAVRQMLGGFRDRIKALKDQGKTLDEVQAAAPTAAFDEKLGGAFIKPAQLVGFIYNSLP